METFTYPFKIEDLTKEHHEYYKCPKCQEQRETTYLSHACPDSWELFCKKCDEKEFHFGTYGTIYE
jgi:hypothetical protein